MQSLLGNSVSVMGDLIARMFAQPATPGRSFYFCKVYFLTIFPISWFMGHFAHGLVWWQSVSVIRDCRSDFRGKTGEKRGSHSKVLGVSHNQQRRNDHSVSCRVHLLNMSPASSKPVHGGNTGIKRASHSDLRRAGASGLDAGREGGTRSL
jgi:hypothetical protein